MSERTFDAWVDTVAEEECKRIASHEYVSRPGTAGEATYDRVGDVWLVCVAFSQDAAERQENRFSVTNTLGRHAEVTYEGSFRFDGCINGAFTDTGCHFCTQEDAAALGECFGVAARLLRVLGYDLEGWSGYGVRT